MDYLGSGKPPGGFMGAGGSSLLMDTVSYFILKLLLATRILLETSFASGVIQITRPFTLWNKR